MKMKKISIVCCLALSGFIANAQATLENAQNLFNANNIADAKKAIDDVMNSGKENSNAAALFTKGAIYQRILDDKALSAANAGAASTALEAYKSFVGVAKKEDLPLVKPNYISLLKALYNRGAMAYSEQKFSDAEGFFGQISTAKSTIEKSGLFSGDKSIDTLIAKADVNRGYCKYNRKAFSEALPFFEDAAKNSITKELDVYLRLASLYAELEQKDKCLNIIKEGTTLFPKSIDLRNEEINFYSLNHKLDELSKKLEELVKEDPKNPAYLFSLATTYEDMIAEGKATDEKSTRNKIVTAYEKAMGIDNKNGNYPYNLGVLYFNQAVATNTSMNKMIAENKKPETLKPERDELLKKAKPMLEKAIAQFEASGLKEVDKINHSNAKAALAKIEEALATK